MSAHTKQCPRCGVKSRRLNCCGIDLGFRRRWRMTTAMIQQVHVIARARKGLDDATYRLHLEAVGVETSKRLTRAQHHALLQRLSALPDSPQWVAKWRRQPNQQAAA